MAVGCCYLKKQKHENDNSEEPLNELGPILCQKYPFMKLFTIFHKLITQNGCHLPLLNMAKNIKTDRSVSQGINKSANFHFLQRLSVIFGFRQDCP